MNNQGQSMIQPILIMVILFAFAIMGFVFIIFTTNLGEGLENSSLNDDPDQASAIASLKGLGQRYVGGTFVFIFFGLVIGLMITSFLIPEHPIFIIAYVLMLFVSIIIAGLIANSWAFIASNEYFVDLVSQQTAINFIMRNIVKIEIVLFALTMIIIFGKPYLFSGNADNSGGRM